MASRQVHDDDVVRLLDLNTGGLLLNSTREEVRQGTVLSDYPRLAHFSVCDPLPELGGKHQGIQLDAMPDGQRETRNLAKVFTQYACKIEAEILRGNNVLVYCKNGRSRSPGVLLAYFIIFRSIPMDHCQAWLRSAYEEQRPKTAEVSSEFPRFSRFESVIRVIKKAVYCPNQKFGSFCLDEIMQCCSNAFGVNLTVCDPCSTLLMVRDLLSDLPKTACPLWAGKEEPLQPIMNSPQCRRLTRGARAKAITVEDTNIQHNDRDEKEKEEKCFIGGVQNNHRLGNPPQKKSRKEKDTDPSRQSVAARPLFVRDLCENCRYEHYPVFVRDSEEEQNLNLSIPLSFDNDRDEEAFRLMSEKVYQLVQQGISAEGRETPDHASVVAMLASIVLTHVKAVVAQP